MTVHREQSMKRERERERERENQQDTTIRCLLSTSVSTCFGQHYAHLQENKGPVTAYGVLLWFYWMWLVAVVGRCVVGCEQCSKHVETAVDNKHLIVASCWFFLSLHNIRKLFRETCWKDNLVTVIANNNNDNNNKKQS